MFRPPCFGLKNRKKEKIRQGKDALPPPSPLAQGLDLQMNT